ncbi:MAG: hypothetical protein HRU20_07775 [Pseudomonadales bacterium]|nr:hypothetical protein [Pseudomonadales bacterium]
MEIDDCLKVLGEEIDASIYIYDVDEIERLIEKSNNLLSDDDSPNNTIINFYKANCYSALSHGKEAEISWKQRDRIFEILHLRKSVSSAYFSQQHPVFQGKVLTNLGIALSKLGRPVEALKSLNDALDIIPDFAMASGNYGVAAYHYAVSLYDQGHAYVINGFAKSSLHNAVAKGSLWDSGPYPEAEAQFKQYISLIDDYYDGGADSNKAEQDRFDDELSEEELIYRRWCLDKKLYLSPLNDVCNFSVAGHDVIHLPSHVYKIGEDPRFPNYYNLLKQEYVTARYMLYEAVSFNRIHLSDKDVLLLSGCSGGSFGYRNEQLKIAYRMTYSLFDKIALFLNDYLRIGLDIGKVTFKSIWTKKVGKKFELRDCFIGNDNWPLRGLYFLSRDLFDKKFSESALPDAKELLDIRNRLEHRFLTLQEFGQYDESGEIHAHIELEELELKAYRIISMAREALIYLSLAMHREERKLSEDREESEFIYPLQSEPIEILE